MMTKTPIIFLAGGKGTRLATLDPSRPKPMILVKDKPFLYWLTKHYRELGYERFLFSTGHLREVVEQYPWAKEFRGVTFSFHPESNPLGTGGAVQAIFENDEKLAGAWVVNGDTLLPAPLPEPTAGTEAFYTVLEKDQLFDATPNLEVRGDRIVAESKNGRFFDGGAVFVTRLAINRYNGPIPCSMHQLLEPAMALGLVGYQVVPGTCYDIGTPARYKRFESYVESKKN